MGSPVEGCSLRGRGPDARSPRPRSTCTAGGAPLESAAMLRRRSPLVLLLLLAVVPALAADKPPGAPGATPPGARLAFEEDWSAGRVDPAKWYLLRKRWGEGNNGVVPENVRVERDTIGGAERNVLVCEAHGDAYDGPVIGEGGRKSRVGGVVVSKPYFASGRFEVVMKLGSTTKHDGGPEDPRRP